MMAVSDRDSSMAFSKSFSSSNERQRPAFLFIPTGVGIAWRIKYQSGFRTVVRNSVHQIKYNQPMHGTDLAVS